MFRVKAEPSNEFKNHLQQYGHNSIAKLYICREPIAKGVELFINAITLGKYSDAKNKLNYDNVFHLYLMILLSSGMWMLLEKNETVVLKPSDKRKIDEFEHMGVFVEPYTLSLKDFIDNAIEQMGKNEFFIYDGITSNCQKFVTDVLVSNGLWNTKYDLFVNQTINQSLDEVKGLKYAMRKITDVANIAKRLVGGTDEVFLIDSYKKQTLQNAFKQLNKIDENDLYSDEETSKAYTAFLNASHQVGDIYRANLKTWSGNGQLPGLPFVNTRTSNTGFPHIVSFEGEANKDNRDNLKKSITRLKEIIAKILDHNRNLTGSGPILSKEPPSRKNESKKFRDQRGSYQEDQKTSLDIRPELFEEQKRARITYLKNYKAEKENERRSREEQNLKSMMEKKTKQDEEKEVRLIKKTLYEIAKRNNNK